MPSSRVLRIGCPALFLAGSAAWWAWRGGPAARDTLFAWGLVYLSYFFATILLAAALCLLAPERFRRYAASICTLSTLGVVTYVLFPAAPPWLAAEHHLTHGLRLVPPIWAHIPYVSFQTLFEHGSHYSNRVAAVPS